jgi:hypothetical protein
MEQRPPLVLSSLILGGSLIVSVFVGGIVTYRVKTFSQAIEVTGSAQKVIQSDVVKWRITLTRSADVSAVQNGYSQLKSDLATLLAFLKKNGLTGTGVTVAPVSIESLMSYSGEMKGPTGYMLHQDITVESKDIDLVTKAAQNAAALIGEGALISTASLEYYYSKLPALRIEMLAAATEDAKARAANIARSAGASLGRLRSASMGVFQVTAPNSIDISDYGTYDTSSVRKQITAIVRASFTIR